MLIFYLLTLFAALPILAYLLSQRTANKGIVLGTTTFVLIGCLILFISKFAILGTVQKQTLSEQINNQIILMTNLVEDLSLIATAESGELSLNKKAIDIKEDINYAVDSFYESAKNKNIEVINKFNQPLILEADQKRVRQIFSNIISNAIKYINSNDQITIDQIEEEKVYKIKFIDNGPGISEDKLDRIFERFYKVDDNRSREIDGSGLGLAITKQLCLSHGWDIEVLSLKDVGTEFHIIIPK